MNNTVLHNTLLTEITAINADWHITLTDDTNHRTTSQYTFEQRIHKYMTTFERISLGRNWFRKYHRFIAIMERHADNTLHAHVVINSRGMTKSELERAFDKVACKIKSGLNVFITPICDRTPEYVLKQMKPDWTGAIDTSPWISSDILLELNHKKKRHRVKGYRKHNINVRNTVGEALGW